MFILCSSSVCWSSLRDSPIFFFFFVFFRYCLFEIDAFHRDRDDIWMGLSTGIILYVFWYVKYGWFWCSDACAVQGTVETNVETWLQPGNALHRCTRALNHFSAFGVRRRAFMFNELLLFHFTFEWQQTAAKKNRFLSLESLLFKCRCREPLTAPIYMYMRLGIEHGKGEELHSIANQASKTHRKADGRPCVRCSGPKTSLTTTTTANRSIVIEIMFSAIVSKYGNYGCICLMAWRAWREATSPKFFFLSFNFFCLCAPFEPMRCVAHNRRTMINGAFTSRARRRLKKMYTVCYTHQYFVGRQMTIISVKAKYTSQSQLASARKVTRVVGTEKLHFEKVDENEFTQRYFLLCPS